MKTMLPVLRESGRKMRTKQGNRIGIIRNRRRGQVKSNKFEWSVLLLNDLSLLVLYVCTCIDLSVHNGEEIPH